MANVNLVTGYTGTAHIRSEDDAFLTRFLWGKNNGILKLTESHTNTLFTLNCDAIIDGRLVRTDGNIQLSSVLPESGYYRLDNIYLEYFKAEDGVEHAEINYYQGTPNVDSATAYANGGQPSYPSGYTNWETMAMISVFYGNDQTVSQVVIDAPSYGKIYLLASLIYNAGSSANTPLANAEGYILPLYGGVNLVVGKISLSQAMQANKTYGFKIENATSQYNLGSVITGGASISVSDWNMKQTYFSISNSEIRVGVTPTTAVSSATIDFWYITMDDFA